MLNLILTLVAVMLALIATILAFIFIIPEKRRAHLGGFGRFMHDFLNFKFLVIEKIIQFCYVLATALTFFGGFAALFSFERSYSFDYYSGTYATGSRWIGYYGFIIMILGPIVVRLVYELFMMAIIAVKNIIQINNKLKNQNEGDTRTSKYLRVPDQPSAPAPAPAQTPAPQPKPVPKPEPAPVSKPEPAPAPAPVKPAPKFCFKCGAPVNEDGSCPNCK